VRRQYEEHCRRLQLSMANLGTAESTDAQAVLINLLKERDQLDTDFTEICKNLECPQFGET
jgi:hypothetical protein